MSNDDEQEQRENNEDAEDPEEVVDDAQGTTSERYRWRYLSTIVTVVVVIGYTGMVLLQATGYAEPTTGGTWATYSVAFLSVVAYSVGVDTLNEVRKQRDG